MATIDIPVAYLHKYSYVEVIIILNVILEDILLNIDPNLYRKYFLLEKGLKVLYVKLQNSLYVLLCSALLFYIKLSKDLKIMVFHKPI